jgi:hypothetical protein
LQKFLSRLFNQLMKSWSWVLLIVLAIAIKWVSLYPDWVEKNYTYGIYPVISSIQRFLFGWIPLSIGDLFYSFLILIIIFRTFQFFKLLFKKKINRKYFAAGLKQAIFFFLFVYVFFNLLWGLNYNRSGIAKQLGLNVKQYTLADLDTLATVLENRINQYAELVTKEQRDSLNKKSRLFRESNQAYQYAQDKFSFLSYHPRSIKPSLFSYLGNYLGFQGYYNAFSGEGQVNTTIPVFMEPFVATHEIAHQVGYARENEANFVGFLACRAFPSSAFRYSVYFDMYNYAIGELGRRDTLLANSFNQKLHPRVIEDFKTMRAFFRKYKNPVEPIIMWGYGHFLKANNQPAGKQSYNEVVSWLIAYYKKFGVEAL